MDVTPLHPDPASSHLILAVLIPSPLHVPRLFKHLCVIYPYGHFLLHTYLAFHMSCPPLDPSYYPHFLLP